VLSARRVPLVVAAALFVLQLGFYASPIGRTEIFRKGEAREALVVTAMLAQRDPVLPRRNGTDIPSKPPLFHWMGAAASVVGGGPSDATIRLPSALCAAGAGTLVLVRLGGVAGVGTALLAVVMLAAMPEWTRNAGAARVDMCFAAAVTASVLALDRVVRDARAGPPWTLLAVMATAASVLAKGPAGLVLPVTIVAGAAAASWGPRGLVAGPRSPLGRLATVSAGALALAGLWYALAYRAGGMEFIRVQLLRENFARLVPTAGIDVGHHKPFYFGLKYLVTAAVPWCLLYPLVAVTRPWRTAARTDGDETDHDETGHDAAESRHLVLLCFAWTAVFTAAVSLSDSKREAYLLPAMPAVAMVLAIAVAGVTASMRRTWAVRLAAAGATLAASVLFLGTTAALAAATALRSEQVRALAGSSKAARRVLANVDLVVVRPALLVVPVAAALAFGLAGRGWWRGRARPGVVGIALGTMILTTAVEQVLEPPFARAHSARPFAEALRPMLGEEPLFQWKCELYALTYQLRRDVPCLRARDVPPPPPYLVLVPSRDLARFRRRHPTATLLRESTEPAANGRGRVALVRVPRPAAP
jgi:4-amino-4-deoxy-L-arabinose transferase-like glycosyltransferase